MMHDFLKHHRVESTPSLHVSDARIRAEFASNTLGHIANQNLNFLKKLSNGCLINASLGLNYLLFAALQQSGGGFTKGLRLPPHSLLSRSSLRVTADQL